MLDNVKLLEAPYLGLDLFLQVPRYATVPLLGWSDGFVNVDLDFEDLRNSPDIYPGGGLHLI